MDEITFGSIGNQGIQRDVHDSPRAKNVCSWTRVFDASAGRKRFFLDLVTVVFKGAEEPPIVVEVGVDSTRNLMRIKAITVRVV